MFTQYSIRKLLVATAGVAILISVVATGIRQDNAMGWGVVGSLFLLPVLLMAYGVVTALAKMFCRLGISVLGPLEAPVLIAAVAKSELSRRDPEPNFNSAATESGEVTDDQ